MLVVVKQNGITVIETCFLSNIVIYHKNVALRFEVSAYAKYSVYVTMQFRNSEILAVTMTTPG